MRARERVGKLNITLYMCHLENVELLIDLFQHLTSRAGTATHECQELRSEHDIQDKSLLNALIHSILHESKDVRLMTSGFVRKSGEGGLINYNIKAAHLNVWFPHVTLWAVSVTVCDNQSYNTFWCW